MNRRHINVLLVEDDASHAELIERAFDPRNGLVSLTVVHSLSEARSEIAATQPDLALIDLLLPDGRGTDLLPPEEDARIRFPVVILTSQGDEEAAVEAMKAGAMNYVVKSWEALADMPRIVDLALREWGLMLERRRAEEALQARERHFRSLIENAQDIIAELDEDRVLRYASPAIEQVLGWRPDQCAGQSFLDLVHDEDRDAVAQQLKQAFAEPGSWPTVVFRCRHRDGGWRHLEAIASSHRESDGARGVLNARDVTDRIRAEAERMRLEKQLGHSQRWELIGSLAGDIAAEFSNVLTPIFGFAELAARTAVDNKTRKGLERILEAARRARELTGQLRDLSRRAEPQRKRIELQLLILDTLKLLRASLPTSIELRHRIDPDCARVMADPSQIKQVLMNLCTNAHHAMRQRGGTLEIQLAAVGEDADEDAPGIGPRPQPMIRLTVCDTGHGMDPATRERAFEPFFTTKGSGEKTGLGLTVTHAIVVSHGGEMAVESEPDKGTKVHVYLPASNDDSGWPARL